MEALILWLRVFVVTVFFFNGSTVNAQNTNSNFENKISESIQKYELTSNKIELITIRILGKNNELALNWFEKNMVNDEEVFHVAALAFSESSMPKWNSRAESMLLKSLRIRPNAYTALKLGYLYLDTDKSKACNFFKQSNDINSTSLGNEQYAFCLMTGVADRIHRKSESEACAIMKVVRRQRV